MTISLELCLWCLVVLVSCNLITCLLSNLILGNTFFIYHCYVYGWYNYTVFNFLTFIMMRKYFGLTIESCRKFCSTLTDLHFLYGDCPRKDGLQFPAMSVFRVMKTSGEFLSLGLVAAQEDSFFFTCSGTWYERKWHPSFWFFSYSRFQLPLEIEVVTCW